MKWIVGLSLLVVGIVWACGGKIVVPPPDNQGDQDYVDIPGVESEVDTGNEEEVVGGDSDMPDNDVDPGDSVGDGEGDSDVVVTDPGSDTDDEVEDGDSDCTGNCCNHPQEDGECDKNHNTSNCHKGKHLCVDNHAVDVHLEHGDDLGNCE